jgi:hypothetical protein
MKPEQDHLALAGFYVAWGLLGRLHGKGVLTTAETLELMDGAILSPEELRKQDDVVRGTPAVLDELLAHIQANSSVPRPPSEG